MKTSLSSWAYATVWILLNCGEMKAFWFWWKHSMFLQMNSSCPFSDTPTTFFLVKHWSWPEMWTSITFGYPFTGSLYFSISFQTLFECGTQPMAEYALKPLCNAETQWGIVYLKDKQFYLMIIHFALGLHYCLVNC